MYEYDQAKGGKLFNLAATLIGNPFVAPVLQRIDRHKVGTSLNIVDDYNMDQIAALRRRCEETISTSYKDGVEACSKTLDYIDTIGGGVLSYDARIFGYDFNPTSKIYEDFLTISGKKNDIYQALHVDKSTKDPIYESSSERVYNAYQAEEMEDYSKYYEWMFTNNQNLLIYAGEWDQQDGPSTHEAWLRNVPHLPTDFFNLNRKIYWVPQGQGFIVGGYYREDPSPKKGFTLLSIPKAGHFVPTDMLETTKQFIIDFVNNKQLMCHKNEEDCSTVTTMCKYMGNCNGHGQCSQVTGQCKCDNGWRGADCSEQAQILTSSYNNKITTNGTSWVFFLFRSGLQMGQTHDFTLSSNFPLDVYVMAGDHSDPNEFEFDAAFKQQNYVRFTSDQYPSFATFTAAVKVNGIDFYSNKFNQPSFTAKFNILNSDNAASLPSGKRMLLSEQSE